MLGHEIRRIFFAVPTARRTATSCMHDHETLTPQGGKPKSKAIIFFRSRAHCVSGLIFDIYVITILILMYKIDFIPWKWSLVHPKSSSKDSWFRVTTTPYSKHRDNTVRNYDSIINTTFYILMPKKFTVLFQLKRIRIHGDNKLAAVTTTNAWFWTLTCP